MVFIKNNKKGFLFLVSVIILLLLVNTIFAGIDSEPQKKDFDPSTASTSDSKDWPLYNTVKNPDVFSDFILTKASSAAVNDYISKNKAFIETGDFGKQLFDKASSGETLSKFWTNKDLNDASKRSILTSLNHLDETARGTYYNKLWGALDSKGKSSLISTLNSDKSSDFQNVRNNFIKAVLSDELKKKSSDGKFAGLDKINLGTSDLKYENEKLYLGNTELLVNKWSKDIEVLGDGSIKATYANQGKDGGLRTINFPKDTASLLDSDGKYKGVELLRGFGGTVNIISNKDGSTTFNLKDDLNGLEERRSQGKIIGIEYRGAIFGSIGEKGESSLTIDSKGNIISGANSRVWTNYATSGKYFTADIPSFSGGFQISSELPSKDFKGIFIKSAKDGVNIEGIVIPSQVGTKENPVKIMPVGMAVGNVVVLPSSFADVYNLYGKVIGVQGASIDLLRAGLQYQGDVLKQDWVTRYEAGPGTTLPDPYKLSISSDSLKAVQALAKEAQASGAKNLQEYLDSHKNPAGEVSTCDGESCSSCSGESSCASRARSCPPSGCRSCSNGECD